MRTGSSLNAEFKGRSPAEFAWFSFGDSTPLTSMNAARAARRIVRAVEQRESMVTLTWQARLLRLAHALAPGVVGRAMALVNRALPSSFSEGEGAFASTEGRYLVETKAVRLWRGAMNQTARRYNQLRDGDHDRLL